MSGAVRTIILVLFALLLGLSQINANAQTEDPRISRLIDIYLQESLGNSDQRLRKFAPPRPLILQLKCTFASQRPCENLAIGNRFQRSVQTGTRLKFVVDEGVHNPDIKLIYADKTTTQAIKRELTSEYSNESVDADDEECQLYFKLNNDKIENVKIVVSADSSDLKQRTCLAIQTFRGLGLSLYNSLPFSKLWVMEPPNGYASISEGDFTQLVQTMGALTYVHMCSDLRPGMNANDIVRQFQSNLNCIQGLKQLPESK